MGLNIKNPRTVALVRELAERTGQTQTSAIERAVAESLERLNKGAPTAAQERRTARIHAVLAEIDASLTDLDRESLRAAQDDLYDEYGTFR